VPDYDGSVLSNLVPGLAQTAVISPPTVNVFQYSSGLSGQPTPQAVTQPYDPGFLDGVRVAGTADPAAGFDFITAPGGGGNTLIRFYRSTGGSVQLVRSFNAFEPGFNGSVYVGAS
jgi:hypothetical protein